MNTQTTSKSYWPAIIISSFILLAAFDAYIIKQALSTDPGTVTEKPYEDSLKYESEIQNKLAARNANLNMLISEGKEPLTIRIEGLHSNQKRNLSIRFLRPDNKNLDRQLNLTSESDTFIAKDITLKSGLWLVEAKLSSEEANDKAYSFSLKHFID